MVHYRDGGDLTSIQRDQLDALAHHNWGYPRGGYNDLFNYLDINPGCKNQSAGLVDLQARISSKMLRLTPPWDRPLYFF